MYFFRPNEKKLSFRRFYLAKKQFFAINILTAPARKAIFCVASILIVVGGTLVNPKDKVNPHALITLKRTSKDVAEMCILVKNIDEMGDF